MEKWPVLRFTVSERSYQVFYRTGASNFLKFSPSPKAVSYSIHNRVSKNSNFRLKFVLFFGNLILDDVPYSIQN